MKKGFLLFWLALCAAVLTMPPALGANADPLMKVRVSNRDFEGSGRSFTLELSGAEMKGEVYVSVYTDSGQLKQFEVYRVEETVPVALRDVEETDRVKAVWVDESCAPVANVKVNGTQSITAESYEEFVEAVTGLLQDYNSQTMGAGAEADDQYALARLIVQSGEALPDLDEYRVVRSVSDSDGRTVLQFDRPADAQACAEYLQGKISEDGYVEPDMLLYVNPEDGEDEDAASDTALSWGVSKIHSDTYAADLIKRGINRIVTVAVVDTGVDYTHPFLQGRMVSGYDFIGNDNDPKDEHYHGTHVAGTVVDCTPGLNVKIMPVRVLDASGCGSDLSVSLGIQYAANNGANVINMSLGGRHSATIDEAVNYAVSRNVVVVVAAGNEYDDAKNHCPAHIEKCITVSAVDSSWKPASFSNHGTVVDLAAPGVNINSCVPGGSYSTLNGTSMASPHAAACAAMIRCEFPGITPSQVESKLVSMIQKPSGWNTKYGPGILDMPLAESGGYAILYTDGELVFQNSGTPASGRTVLQKYSIRSISEVSPEYAGWYDQRSRINKVTFQDKTAPGSTALWFYDCANLTSIQGLDKLDTSGTTSMSQMFSLCTGLTSLNLSSFNTGKVTDMSQMFFGCEKLQTLNLRGWNTGNVTSMRDMFTDCQALTTIYADSTFSVTKVTDGGTMFQNCTRLRGGSGTSYTSGHQDKTYARIDGGSSNPGYFTGNNPVSGLYAILYNDGELVFQTNSTPASGRTVVQTYAVSAANGGTGEYAGWYDQRSKIKKVTFREKVSPSSTALWFYDCANLTTVQNISNLDTSKITNMSQMFSQCTSLASLNLSSFSTGNATDMGQMFFGCEKLQTLDLSSWNTGNVTSMRDMFHDCKALTTIYASTTFTVAKVTDGGTMFQNCTRLSGGSGTGYTSGHQDETYARIDGGSSNPGYFTDKNAVRDPAPNPSTSLYAVLYTDGALVFQSSTTPQSGKTAREMYETDSGGYDGGTYTAWYEERAQIRSVDFAVKIAPSSTALWFYGCENLASVKNMSNLYTDYVTDMSQMFSYCSNLTSLDLSGFHTSKTTNTAMMFYHCSNLTTIWASASFTTSTISDSRRMFDGCMAIRGGNGTTYSDSYVDKTYARIDQSSAKGYFTAK